MHQHSREIRTGHPILDIGDDMGGVIFFAPPELRWQEIEIAALATPGAKTHTEVTERLAGSTVTCTGVFPPLPIGDYRVCRPASRAGEAFTVFSGQVTQIDWRSEPLVSNDPAARRTDPAQASALHH